MSKKINSTICSLINDGLHYLIGIIIVAIIIYIVIQLHNHFSKNNVPIKVSNKKISNPNPTQNSNLKQGQQPISQ
jgi:large-conductance mechanosensitive channel